MKRWEAIAILKEILAACESQINLKMVWIKEEPKHSAINNISYSIVMKAKFDKKALICVAPINEKYMLKMYQENEDLWVFRIKANGSERVAPSTNTI